MTMIIVMSLATNLLLLLVALFFRHLETHNQSIKHYYPNHNHHCHHHHHNHHRHHNHPNHHHHEAHILAELDLDGGAGIDSVGGTGRVRNRHAHVAFNLGKSASLASDSFQFHIHFNFLGSLLNLSAGGHRNGEASFGVDVLAFQL